MQANGRPKLKAIDRKQGCFTTVRPDDLIGADHAARVIWELSGALDLTKLESRIRSFEGQAGSSCWPPRLLLCVWLYAYQQRIGAAREITRQMEHEPGLRWLCGMEVINLQTLCSFRVQTKGIFEDLLAQMLAVLAEEKLVDLRTAVHDGTKIQSRGGKGSAHRRATLEQRYQDAKAYMEQVDHEASEQPKEAQTRREAAVRSRARERLQRLESALAEMTRREEAEPNSQKRARLRVSESEPEARLMRHTEHGGWLQSYNVQLTAETRNNFIVGVQVTSDQNDTQQLLPALQTVAQLTGRKPEQIVADEGYVTRDNIQALAAEGVELIAPVPDELARNAASRARLNIAAEFDASRFEPQGKALRCPAGKELVMIAQKTHHGLPQRTYAAAAGTCSACPHKPRCCPHSGAQGRLIHRIIEPEPVVEHRRRMSTERCRDLYRLRSRIGEFCQMRWKSNWRLRRFSVFGKSKTQAEALLMALAFNFSQWRWARAQAQSA
jgi:transposase